MADTKIVSNKTRRQILAPHRHPWPNAEIAIRDDEYLNQAFHIIIGYIQRPNRAGFIDDLEYKNYLVTLVQIAKMISRRNNNLHALVLKPADWVFFDRALKEVKQALMPVVLEKDGKMFVKARDGTAIELKNKLEGEPDNSAIDIEASKCKSEEAKESEETNRTANEQRANRLIQIQALRNEIARLTHDIHDMTLQGEQYESTATA
ncbi:hypothetical protein PTT_11301 [Pyrenophora teres f. teres 0-1]|uniref:Uncharacterized protein n=1 Tax=Pyrenophora teres f. teres (strain 0-1) TaxID=861557 RepID=E3RR89_PYRTT|nr:hypothetical protein PTT_11301 [Pyrenophora teres f. teres 0-1]